MAIILNGFRQWQTLISSNSISWVKKRYASPQLTYVTASATAFRLVAVFWSWRKRAIERNYLLNSDHRLRLDLFATRQDIESEVVKPFWRP